MCALLRCQRILPTRISPPDVRNTSFGPPAFILACETVVLSSPCTVNRELRSHATTAGLGVDIQVDHLCQEHDNIAAFRLQTRIVLRLARNAHHYRTARGHRLDRAPNLLHVDATTRGLSNHPPCRPADANGPA